MQIKPFYSTLLTLVLLLTSSAAATTLAPPHTPSYIKKAYLPLLDELERFNAYVKDNKERQVLFQDLNAEAKKTNNAHMKERVSHAKNMQEMFIEARYQDTLDLVLGKISIDSYLFRALTQRYDYLKNRKTRVEDYWFAAGQDAKKSFIVPSDEQLANLVMEIPAYRKFKSTNEAARLDNIECYQFYNLHIILACRICNPSELTLQTIQQLRACKQLHAILNYQTSDLGHPDQAGGYGMVAPLLHALRNAYFRCKKPNKPLDVDGIIHALCDQQHQLSSAKNETSKALVTLLEALTRGLKYTFCSKELKETATLKSFIICIFGLCQKCNEGSPKIKAAFDIIGAHIDEMIYEGHFQPRERRFFCKGLGMDPKSSFPGYMTDHAYHTIVSEKYRTNIFDTHHVSHHKEKWAYKLPTLDFLQKKQNASMPLGMPVFSTHHPYKQPTAEEKICVEPSNNSPCKPSAENESNLKEASTHMNPTTKEKKQQQSIVQKLLHTTLDEIEQQSRQKLGPVLAKGLRIFHHQTFSNKNVVLKKLPTKHQKTVDALFDSKKQCSVTCSDIEAAWISAGGAVNAGNHQELLDEKGKVIGRLFGHGKKQQYGKRSVKYIKSYFTAFGCYPSCNKK